jgi:hypothetical protein
MGYAKLQSPRLGYWLPDDLGEIVVGKRSVVAGHGGSLGGNEPVELVRVADPVELGAAEWAEVVCVG